MMALREHCRRLGVPDTAWLEDARDRSGLTPLMYAVGMGRSDTVNFLLGAGADVFAVDDIKGRGVLHFALYGKRISAAQLRFITKHMLARRPDALLACDNDGHTVLHSFVSTPAHMLPATWTALRNVVVEEKHRYASIVDARCAEEGLTALHLAVRQHKMAFVEFCMEMGACPATCDSRGRFAWELADEDVLGGGEKVLVSHKVRGFVDTFTEERSSSPLPSPRLSLR